MSKGLEALEKIKNIELSHIEQSMVENYDDSYECFYEEVDDGTVEECYDEEIGIIEKALKELEQQSFIDFLDCCCLGFCELKNYLNKKSGYAIHIGNLEIFGKPKDLSEFYTVGYLEALENSLKAKPFPISSQFIQNQYLLRKAPQNFCYVEVGE